MAVNRNDNSFGALLTIISILVIAFLLAFTVHKTVPVVPADEEGYYEECCTGEEGSCCGNHDDEDEEMEE